MKGWRDSVLAGGDEHGKGMEEEGEGAKGGREEYGWFAVSRHQ